MTQALRNDKARVLSDDAIHALLRALDNKRFVSFHFNDTPSRSQCLLLGADLQENRLLLGELYPQPAAEHVLILQQQSFWIQLLADDGFVLTIQVRSRCRVADMLEVEIIDSHWSKNRRWLPRAHFHQHRGPAMSVLPDDREKVDGYLRNLSPCGGCVDFWNQDLRPYLRKGMRLSATMYFNEHFEIHLPIRLLDVAMLRKPCCHTQVRFLMCNVDIFQQNQISQFVYAFQGEASLF